MPTKLQVDPELAEKVKTLLASEAMPFALTDDGSADLKIASGDKNNECTLEAFYAGGWIACLTAHKLAEKLGVETRTVGKLANALDVKIKICELGCF